MPHLAGVPTAGDEGRRRPLRRIYLRRAYIADAERRAAREHRAGHIPSGHGSAGIGSGNGSPASMGIDPCGSAAMPAATRLLAVLVHRIERRSPLVVFLVRHWIGLVAAAFATSVAADDARPRVRGAMLCLPGAPGLRRITETL